MIPCSAVASHAACPSPSPSRPRRRRSRRLPCFFPPSTLSTDIRQHLQLSSGAPYASFIARAASGVARPFITLPTSFSMLPTSLTSSPRLNALAVQCSTPSLDALGVLPAPSPLWTFLIVRAAWFALPSRHLNVVPDDSPIQQVRFSINPINRCSQ